MKPKYILFIFILFSAINISAQENLSLEELFDEGEFFFWKEEYKEAVYYYKQLAQKEPDNSNFNFKVGECYLNIPGEEPKAIPYFQIAVKNITRKQDYKLKSFREKKAPLHAYFYLGNAYRVNNELGKALECYDIFTNHPHYFGNYNLTVVENEIEACERAKIIKDSPIEIKRTNIESPINSSRDNSYPVISGDESTLIFVTSLQFYDGIFYSKKDKDNKWSEPINITPQVMSDGDLYPTGISFDGKELIMVKKTRFNDDLYISSYDGEQWSVAKPIGKPINTKLDENYGSFSPDGNQLYFSSNRFGGEGGFDIYVSEKNKNGEWEKPKNLGKLVNSEFDEVAPRYISNPKILFFSSNGHYGMGGYDVFYSIYNENNNRFGDPINIGYPVNTTSNDDSFYPLYDGKTYYSANKHSNSNKNLDIFRTEIISPLKSISNK
jgi:hypothetical protein